MTNNVFISYSRRDLAFVSQLYQALKQRGISAWFDEENIKPADHRPTRIVQGIQNCKILLLVLSPDAVQSVDIRKEVDLAERHKKPIIPLQWRKTEVPATFEHALAGLQSLNFRETASKANFDELANAITRLLGDASIDEAASKQKSAESPAVPALSKETPAPPLSGQKLGSGRKLIGAKTKLNAIVIGGMVISGVITTSNLAAEDQDFVNNQLKWLFAAADKMIQIQNETASIEQEISVPIPAGVIRETNANNKLFPAYNSPRLVKGLVSHLKRINQQLKNLDLLLETEVNMGQAAAKDEDLQFRIKQRRLDIVKILKQIAELMYQAYGIKVTAPDKLLEFLEDV